jgi:hypothetical protein
MSLESDVAHVLRAHPVDRISFKVENIAIDRTQMDLVAKAIEKGGHQRGDRQYWFSAGSRVFVVRGPEIQRRGEKTDRKHHAGQ